MGPERERAGQGQNICEITAFQIELDTSCLRFARISAPCFNSLSPFREWLPLTLEIVRPRALPFLP